MADERIWSIRRYTAADAVRWNQFIAESRNGTFLFDRGYMDYHSDRFTDCSLMAFLGGHLAAVLPADIRGHSLRSHGGLTYGGWVLPRNRVDGSDVVSLFETTADFCRAAGLHSLIYRPAPRIYHLYPSDEDLYALFRLGAVRTASLLSSAIDRRHPRPFATARRRQVRRAAELPYSIAESHDYASFWRLLEGCLDERHGARPVHTAAEIAMLAERFPSRIRLFTISAEGRGHAGVVIYDTGICAHCQYIASDAEARMHNLLPLLFDHLAHDTFAGRDYFDYGTSNEDAGLMLNAGLLNQKYTLGGTGVTYDTYTLTL